MEFDTLRPMDLNIQTGQTKAPSGVKLIAQTHKSALNEQVILLLQVHASPSESKTLEKEAVDIMKHALLETEGEAAHRLDGTLKELNGLFKGLLAARKLDDVHAILAIIDATGSLHVSHAGRAEAYVIRGGSASQITEYTRGKPTPAFVHIASGSLENGDHVVCATQRLLRTLTPAQLSKLAPHGDGLTDEIISALQSEKEISALSHVHVVGSLAPQKTPRKKKAPARKPGNRRGRRRSGASAGSILSTVTAALISLWESIQSLGLLARVQDIVTGVLSDLGDPKRKRRAHLFILATVFGAILLIWIIVNVTVGGKNSAVEAELQQIITEVEQDLETAENRYLTGEIDSANAILQRAYEQISYVIDHPSEKFRKEAHLILGRVRSKQEQVNNIERHPPNVVAELADRHPDVSARGIIGLGEGEFYAYDAQSIYRILLNTVEDPEKVVDEELIRHGTPFPRYQSTVFQTNAGTIVEIIDGQSTTMKTEDPAGWIAGTAMEAYLRYLYVLSPENNQIYKYERFSNRYSSPSEYNIDGNLEGALDVAIDGNVYILKEGGTIVKLFRGEAKSFTIDHLQENLLQGSTKIYKVFDGNFYILQPGEKRVVVVEDSDASGNASYVKQYILEGQGIGVLRDLYVDEDETKLYVLDEKRLYSIDL